MTIPRATAIGHAHAGTDHVALDYEGRLLRRKRLVSAADLWFPPCRLPRRRRARKRTRKRMRKRGVADLVVHQEELHRGDHPNLLVLW